MEEGIDTDKVLATITLPYTNQNTNKFVSIHSNPPGVATDIPAMAITDFGDGKVFWSALPIEQTEFYHYRNIFTAILKFAFDFEPTVKSDAPKDVEIITFVNRDEMYVNTVALNEDYKARKYEDFEIRIASEKDPKT